MSRRIGPWLRWITGVLAVLVVCSIAVIVVLWRAARPDAPDAFYEAPPDLPPVPGALLRSEPFARDVPSGARGWRILYTTTRTDGAPAVASAIVLAPVEPPAGPRPVVVWNHGTKGIVPGCAPSLVAHPFANVPALDSVVTEGWIFVATDYVGLGTRGPHPYLIGPGQAFSALDAVRAARHMQEIVLGDRNVVWGHSQGGHAALWTGIRAPDHAPDVALAGVAALAPASDLPNLLREIQASHVGRILGSYALRAYADAYADVDFDAYTRPAVRLLARDMAGRCLDGKRALFSVFDALLADGSIFAVDPTTGAFGDRLRENVPAAPIDAPVFVAQGLADDLVLPAVQRRFVDARCAAGHSVDYRTYAGRDHLSLVAADSPLQADLVAWTRDRFAAAPAAAGCTTIAR